MKWRQPLLSRRYAGRAHKLFPVLVLNYRIAVDRYLRLLPVRLPAQLMSHPRAHLQCLGSLFRNYPVLSRVIDEISR